MTMLKTLQKLIKDNQSLLIFILLMSCFRSAIADWYIVPTGSMKPTILEGDQITVNKIAYDLKLPFTSISLLKTGAPAHGDIIVFESVAADTRLIKRVIGLPGDVVSMNNNVVTINGTTLNQRLLSETTNEYLFLETLDKSKHITRLKKHLNSNLSSFPKVTVPDGHYLVLGDNRLNSADSRVYGFVPHHELKGKATHVAFSRDYDNLHLPRSERWFKSLYQ